MANGHLSDYFADILIQAWLTRDVSLLPTIYYVGLTLELPIDNNGTGLVPPEAAEFARKPIPAEDTFWVSMGVGSRAMETAFDTTFDVAVIDWGEINGYTLYDSLIDGNFLGYGITNPFTILAGMSARLPAGAIVILQPI